MRGLDELLSQGAAAPDHHPWPRVLVDRRGWRAALGSLAAGRVTLLGLWGDARLVHLALLDEISAGVGVLSLACKDGRLPSVGLQHPPAIRLERALADLHGLDAEGAPDQRPWLDHGRWTVSRPLGAASSPVPPTPYPFLPAEGEALHQIPVGPVHAGIIEPGHFRFTASGETIVRLEVRLGYAHRGLEDRMAGATPKHGAALAGRASGDSTVAYALAFARAVEAAGGIETPARAVWLRALMAELERIANHLGDVGAICNDAAFGLLHAPFGALRETVLRACATAFGHRLMMDGIVPGGVAADLAPASAETLSALAATIRRRLPALVAVYDDTASLQDRMVGTGTLKPELARRFGAGGFVGRASGRAFDARRRLAYPPYDQLNFTTPLREEGDVNARVWIRIDEIGESLSLVDQLLTNLPSGPWFAEPAPTFGPGEGMALIEGFRGDILAWVRLGDDGRIQRCHLRDPSWFQWPLLEACVEGNIVADFPLCNKSFNCAYAGCDL